MAHELKTNKTPRRRTRKRANGGLRPVVIVALCLALQGTVTGEEFVKTYIREQNKRYQPRPGGFDMNRNGIVGEAADSRLGDGQTADPDAGGDAEDLIYVDAEDGNDTSGKGTAVAPYQTIEKALASLDGPGDGADVPARY